MKVPLVDLGWQHQQVADDVAAGWAAVVEATAFVGGAAVADFERAFAGYLGVPHCTGVANGTDALEVALRALGVGHGDTVVVPANSFIASAEAVLRAGATPRLADVDDDTLLLDPVRLDLDGVTAVMPVHLFGQMAPMRAILDVAGDRPVVEDAAQAQGAQQDGAPIGRLGAAAGTSFYPGKNLGAYGEAGAVVTTDAAVDDAVRLLVNHGSRSKYDHETFGFNSRLDPLQAVVLSAKLARLEEWNELRRAAARRYDELLAGLDGVRRPVTAPGNLHVWHLYTVRVADRDDVLGALHAADVGAGIHYPVPLHLTSALRNLGHDPGDFPVAEKAAAELLSLPIYPGITSDQQEYVVDTLRTALR
ncbi:MAG TPA: DegT/DnrJ/EryC1/StrS family aminotransferase [Mycobacteriales bacterium]|nr:DegT/DnrJ/EryC1/StrS family aminotransferase [Mycobacteriales bacterium]